MTCTDCVSFYGDKIKTDNNLQKTNTFILGCTHFRTSSGDDYETCKSHQKAHDFIVGKQKSDREKINSEAVGPLKNVSQQKIADYCIYLGMHMSLPRKMFYFVFVPSVSV